MHEVVLTTKKITKLHRGCDRQDDANIHKRSIIEVPDVIYEENGKKDIIINHEVQVFYDLPNQRRERI